MIPEIGFFFLCLSFFISLIYLFLNIGLFIKQRESFIGDSVVTIFFLSVITSFICLEVSFLLDDFSVLYVANNSNANLPNYFKFAALWGGHEGSMLLYLLFMSVWIFIIKSKNSLVLLFCFFIYSLFSGFVIFTSNPFERLLPFPAAGGLDLNPLLQDFAFTIHPPTLYLGYTALIIPFSIAMARCLDSGYKNWADDLRNWATLSWSFLTLGIALGSWWAYYELGWGGWWFWDPVENSSLIPWLISTALIHSSIATSKRGIFSSWTILLAIGSLGASYIGLFLVRSGIVTSVHTFALDPERGVVLLGITLLVFLVAMFVYLNSKFNNQTNEYSFFSKEFFLLINNTLLVILALVILFGTVYPIIYEVLTNGKDIAVGKPYFDLVTVPIALFLALFQGFGVITNWSADKSNLKVRYFLALIIITLIAIIFTYVYSVDLEATLFITYLMFAAIISGLIIYFLTNPRKQKVILVAFPMLLSHFGVALMILGIGLVSNLETNKELIADINNSFQVKDYKITLQNEIKEVEPNFISEKVKVEIINEDKSFYLFPEKRFYPVSGNVMTEAAISPGFSEDLYISLGEKLGSGWVIKTQIKPFIRFIWLGAILMAVGGLFSVFYRRGI